MCFILQTRNVKPSTPDTQVVQFHPLKWENGPIVLVHPLIEVVLWLGTEGRGLRRMCGWKATATKTHLLAPQPHKKQGRCLPWTKTDDRSKTGKNASVENIKFQGGMDWFENSKMIHSLNFKQFLMFPKIVSWIIEEDWETGRKELPKKSQPLD